jgi:hypothetical protein
MAEDNNRQQHVQPDFKEYVKNLNIAQLNTLEEHIKFEKNKLLEKGCVIELTNGIIDTVMSVHTEITSLTLKEYGKTPISNVKRIKHTNQERIEYNNKKINQENDAD